MPVVLHFRFQSLFVVGKVAVLAASEVSVVKVSGSFRCLVPAAPDALPVVVVVVQPLVVDIAGLKLHLHMIWESVRFYQF